MFASGQIVSQKLLASDEAGSFLQNQLDDEWCMYDGCDFSLKGNGVCDRACISVECGYDGGDCDPNLTCYESGCIPELLGNGKCDDSCNTFSCRYDHGEC
jgi:hypothetical protein